MPSQWRAMYNSGRQKLRKVKGIRLPEIPTPEQAMELLGITAGGKASSDRWKGPHKVPQNVRDDAMHGIRLSYEHNYGSWDFIGLARAIELAISPGVPDSTHKRMNGYFTRHQKDKNSARFGDETHPSRGYMAWLNWGGDPGQEWAAEMVGKQKRKVRQNPSSNPFTPACYGAASYSDAASAYTVHHFSVNEPFHRRSD